MAIIAIIGVTVLSTESGMLKRAYAARDNIARLVLLNNFLEDSHILEQTGQTPLAQKTIEEPLTQLKYTSRPAQGSAFSTIENLVIEKVTATWQSFLQEDTEQFIALHLTLPKEES
jgi:hypothetical protein